MSTNRGRWDRLASRVEQLAEQNAALRSEVGALRAQLQGRSAGLTGRARLSLVGLLVLAVSAFPLVALAHTGYFSDVPHGAQFHDEINAIAGAGITTGCSATPTYCPDGVVDRKAMAAFMSRGFGRIGGVNLPFAKLTASVSSISGWSTTLTPGLPAGLLSGAAGFIKADATVTIVQSGTAYCNYFANLLIDGTVVTTNDAFATSISSSAGGYAMLSLTGAKAVTSAGAKAIEVRVWKATETCDSSAWGNLTAIYAPFGHAGGNSL